MVTTKISSQINKKKKEGDKQEEYASIRKREECVCLSVCASV